MGNFISLLIENELHLFKESGANGEQVDVQEWWKKRSELNQRIVLLLKKFGEQLGLSSLSLTSLNFTNHKLKKSAKSLRISIKEKNDHIPDILQQALFADILNCCIQNKKISINNCNSYLSIIKNDPRVSDYDSEIAELLFKVILSVEALLRKSAKKY